MMHADRRYPAAGPVLRAGPSPGTSNPDYQCLHTQNERRHKRKNHFFLDNTGPESYHTSIITERECVL